MELTYGDIYRKGGVFQRMLESNIIDSEVRINVFKLKKWIEPLVGEVLEGLKAVNLKHKFEDNFKENKPGNFVCIAKGTTKDEKEILLFGYASDINDYLKKTIKSEPPVLSFLIDDFKGSDTAGVLLMALDELGFIATEKIKQ